MADKSMSGNVRHTVNRKMLLFGAAVGLVYGLLIRFGFQATFLYRFGGLMAWGFLIGVPFAMGFITIFVIQRREPQPFWIWIVWPWAAVCAGALGTFLVFVEGIICIAMFLPIALVCASVGGVLAGTIVQLSGSSKTNDVIAGVVVLFPLIIAPCEGRVLFSTEIHTTENVIEIAAPSHVIWSNIERVRAIQPSELPDSWSHRIGFPNPVEATLSHEGVGGVRRATFTGGVLFIETIDTWEPEQRLAFSIKAQADKIPSTTLDEHVRVGGRFFDVLHGEYRLEPLENGVVRLHLSSQQRLSTDFNWYARIWSDATMSDLQSRILKVIKARCESGSPVFTTEN
jgi:hypothetical protein